MKVYGCESPSKYFAIKKYTGVNHPADRERVGNMLKSLAMRVLVLGATGGTGLELVKQALGTGHQVNALVRNPEKLKQFEVVDDDDKLKVIKGDVYSYDDMKKAMTGCDAVFSSLGGYPRLFKPCDIYSKTCDVIVKVMKELEIKRFISVTASGTKDDPNLPFMLRWVLKPTLYRNVCADMIHFEDKLVNEVGEDINWTVVKPPYLLDTPLTGIAPAACEGQSVPGYKHEICRADMAKFMLDCLVSSEWDRKLVSVARGHDSKVGQE
ncbi:flavin reductase (NADPH)-like [Plakobranchus ocellatus]|uniref:Flavin reductase (NADPH)-like n=1 Tax=Plakobranchus ocellatus TaxID=259542 RepID=A0AAV4DMK0_9GAST|nr:flavin reductase (NADPH)-like [Plakobranchus ocellatus]